MIKNSEFKSSYLEKSHKNELIKKTCWWKIRESRVVCNCSGPIVDNLGEPKWYGSMMSSKLNYHLGATQKGMIWKEGLCHGNRPFKSMDPSSNKRERYLFDSI